jgi:general secretion pathway protein G
MLHRLRRAPIQAHRTASPKTTRPATKHSSGFTLVELMVVMLIISILLAIAVPSYMSAIRSAREAALREDLHTMRDAIEQYTEDKEQAPQSLDDLVQSGYLKALPIDPMTHRADTWVPDQSDTYSSVDQSQTGINDVHSGSDQVGGNGEPYSQW